MKRFGVRGWVRATVLAAATVAFASPSSSAQELRAFEFHDFLDPAMLAVDSEAEEPETLSFFASRFFLGFLDEYQRRDHLTDDAFTFARATGSFYRGRHQFTIEATRLERLGLEPDRIGEIRFGLGRYFELAGSDAEERLPMRALLSWRTTSGEMSGFEDEISLVVDLAAPVPRTDMRVYGGHVLTYVPRTDYAFWSYVYRSNLARWQNEITVELGLGLGAEYVEDSLRWGHSRLEISLLLPLDRFNSYLHLLAAPRYHPHPPPGVDSFDIEIGAFLDSSVFSKIFASNRYP